MQNQLSILSNNASRQLSENDVMPRIYDSVPKVRKLYKFLNDSFSKMKKTTDGEKELHRHFKLSQEIFMDNLNYLVCFVASIQMLVRGNEVNVYTERQIKLWNKTLKQLMDFEKKYKKHVIELIREIPCDLTENIASYL
jgi:hypothetical protein